MNTNIINKILDLFYKNFHKQIINKLNNEFNKYYTGDTYGITVTDYVHFHSLGDTFNYRDLNNITNNKLRLYYQNMYIYYVYMKNNKIFRFKTKYLLPMNY